MKTSQYILTQIVMVWLMAPVLSFGGTIRASAIPATSTAVQAQTLIVPITIDLTGLQEKLGSYTATVRWDNRILKYSNFLPGTTPGFAAPIVNGTKTEQGVLFFTAANPFGAEGSANILNVVFTVIGSESEKTNVKLQFSAMAAAVTFTNLMPFVITLEPSMEQTITVVNPPTAYRLDQNYPNPFNPTTKMSYCLPKAEHVLLAVYNMLGQYVRTLVDEDKDTGHYAAIWDGKDDRGQEVPIGIYFYKLQTKGFIDTKQMLFVK